MAGSLISLPLFMCVLGLMCCGSVADSRVVVLGDQYQALVDEYGVDDGPRVFTMEDHIHWVEERQMARGVQSDTSTGPWGTVHLLSQGSDDEDLIFSDYHDPDSNHIHDIPKR